jgi:hypothetical protein
MSNAEKMTVHSEKANIYKEVSVAYVELLLYFSSISLRQRNSGTSSKVFGKLVESVIHYSSMSLEYYLSFLF